MQNSSKNIDDIFKERLDNYTETPPAEVWNKLQSNLKVAKPSGINLPVKGIGYFLVASVIAVAVVFVMSKNMLNSSSNNASIAINVPTEQQAQQAEDKSTIKSKNDVKESTPAIKETDKRNIAAVSNKEIIQSNSQTAKNITGNVNNSNANNQLPSSSGNILTESKATTQPENKKTISKKQTNTNWVSSIVPDYTSVTKNNRALILNTDNEKTIQSSEISNASDNNVNPATSISKDFGNSTTKLNSGIKNNEANQELQAHTSSNSESIMPVKTFVDAENPVRIEPQINSKTSGGMSRTSFNLVPKPYSQKVELGIMGGYETGQTNKASKNYLFASYAQYNLNNRFALLLQPGIRSSVIQNQNLNGTLSFYKINNDGTFRQTDSSLALVVVDSAIVDTFISRTYKYVQTHDSITKSYRIGGTYISFELPVLLKFKLLKNLSILGGINISINTLVGINEVTSSVDNIAKTGSSSTVVPNYVPAPTPTPIEKIIMYSGTPITAYSGPLYSVPKGMVFSYGFMAGLSYEIWQKFTVEALVTQSIAKSNVVGGYDINSSLSSMYYRFMLGYKLN